MALTNYNILTCTGTAIVQQDLSQVVTFDVTQGAVLDALKAGVAVYIVIKSDENALINITNFELVNSLATTVDGTYCLAGDYRMDLDDPDELLSCIIENE